MNERNVSTNILGGVGMEKFCWSRLSTIFWIYDPTVAPKRSYAHRRSEAELWRARLLMHLRKVGLAEEAVSAHFFWD